MKVVSKLTLIAAIALVLTVGAAGTARPAPKNPPANLLMDFSQARSLPYETTGQVMFENVIIDN
jgi:hypothetical protein